MTLPYRLVKSPLSLLMVAFLWALSGCAPTATAPTERAPSVAETPAVNADQLLTDIRTLASPEMEGRRPGTLGHERAQVYIRQRFMEAGLQPIGNGFDHPFTFVARGETDTREGVNLIGFIRGTEDQGRRIVVTAHYDHLGVRGGEIFHGADDNASGTAALFAIADHFRRNPPRHTIVVAALDAEEMGLRGARAFVAEPPFPREQIALNVNLDMLSRSERGELYAAGTYHSPFLAPHVVATAERSPISLLMGHDDPALGPREDWTMLSDHGAFHEAGIPFIYFGVEDHPDYHSPTDTFENIDPKFYTLAVSTIIDFIAEADRNLAAIAAARP